jgi:hypothetical protein
MMGLYLPRWRQNFRYPYYYKKEKEETHALIEILFYPFCVGWISEKEGKEKEGKGMNIRLLRLFLSIFVNEFNVVKLLRS